MKYPSEWKETTSPEFPVTKIVSIDADGGVSYSVRVGNGNRWAYEEGEGENQVWSKFVEAGFSCCDSNNLEAEIEQQAIYDAWVKALHGGA